MIFVYNNLRYHSGRDECPDPSALGDVVDLEDHVFHAHQLGGPRYLRIAIKEGTVFAAKLLEPVDFRITDSKGRTDLSAEYGVPARTLPSAMRPRTPTT